MRHHQKYLSVEDADGKLAPHFIAVMNTNGDPEGLVRSGNERVLRARFNDARFFWDQDQKKKLEDRRGGSEDRHVPGETGFVLRQDSARCEARCQSLAGVNARHCSQSAT